MQSVAKQQNVTKMHNAVKPQKLYQNPVQNMNTELQVQINCQTTQCSKAATLSHKPLRNMNTIATTQRSRRNHNTPNTHESESHAQTNLKQE